MFKISIIISLLLPSVSFAQDAYSGATLILSSYSFISAIAVGILTSIMVLINARKMKGGIFGSVLYYIGVGMLFVIGGFAASFLSLEFPVYVTNMLRDILFIAGYVIMAIGAGKLFHITRGN
ncbi:MAG: hypothetical protein BMS9Abin13_114 [Patescibacteria group bacterium]|nr:MAG: hypothetical protein BMS9Abin13_114 [Patescibacteria group bacterium]